MSAAEPLLVESPLLEVVIPVHNEEVALATTVHRVTRHLDALPWTWQVTIADNASTDGTPLEAHRLAKEYPGVRVVTLAEKGRGRALKRVWAESEAEVLAYMDVDRRPTSTRCYRWSRRCSAGTRTWRSAPG